MEAQLYIAMVVLCGEAVDSDELISLASEERKDPEMSRCLCFTLYLSMGNAGNLTLRFLTSHLVVCKLKCENVMIIVVPEVYV
ncbi:hypothetical protein T4B_1502 [Trichinella pseudospiralis]|uniref:Uncharacterized protein n=1 Tax=Trichinella pseudospiralis TaxID=6337 RepID=A0A0V1IZD2_TRIPS|nr:hypothetical protein T4B_1502 [Trichinella pseudospiralis]